MLKNDSILLLSPRARVRLAFRRALDQLGHRVVIGEGWPASEDLGDYELILLDLELCADDQSTPASEGLPPILLIGDGEADCAHAGRIPFPDGIADLETHLRPFLRSREAAVIPLAMPDGKLLGISEKMVELRAQLDRLASLELTVLLRGESGTGKELAARHLHEAGPRASEPFVVVHCGAIPAPLLESELFGHVKGSFTGATRERIGRLRSAGKGTLLLDEIAELPLDLQSKLLRVLEAREIWPVGADSPIPLRSRIVAATNRSLTEMVATGEFREDLLHRLAQLSLHIPPLRERPEDIALLSSALLHRHSTELDRQPEGLDHDALDALHQHPWSGNVRELSNRLRRAVALSEGGRLSVDDLELGESAPSVAWELSLRAEFERGLRAGNPPGPWRRELLERASSLLESEKSEVTRPDGGLQD